MNKQTILRFLKYIGITFLTLFIALFLLGGGVFLYFVSKAPALSESKLVATTSSKIYDNKNELIADLGSERRVNAQANEIPTDLVKAIVSIEDHRFFDHRGVDTIRIMGAALRNLQGGGGLQGASTLTQQLIKLTYFSTSTADQTLSRKAQEAWLAVQLEQKATKQEILTYYINKVYMSNGNYGMQTAAQNYYGKDLKDLSLPQLALLAGMPQAPNQYDPYSHPEAALERRNLVLSEMKGQKYISAEDYEKAINTPITDGLQSLKSANSYPAYMDNYLKEVIDQVEQETGYNLLTTGMDVYTNVDKDVQQRLWDVYNTDQYVTYPDDMQVASTIVDVSNGNVIAQLGARHQASNVSFGTNQAVETNRDWGSAMKPITDYAPALEYGVYDSTASIVRDVPYNYPGTDTPLYNWDHVYFGNITIQYALQQSRNVTAVETLNKVGLDRAKTFLNGLGIDYPSMYYANAISSNTTESNKQYGASSEKMAAAYAAFANGGIYHKPMYINKIVFSDGSEKEFSDAGTRAMKETTAYMMTEMMKTVLAYGSGRGAYLPWLPQAGKTGTSNYTDDEIEKYIKNTGYVAPDETFVGYTRKYSMAVWTGYSNRLTPIVGDSFLVAAKVYRSMISYLSEDDQPGDWTMPDGLFRNGEFVFQNSAKNTWNNSVTQQTQTVETPSTTAESSTTQASTTVGQQPNNAPATDPNQGQAGQAGQPTQPVQPTPQNPQVQQPQQ
ncbi:penicillin-binding protein PBP1A [Streptococcus mitis]|uniref:penicillin-binding protein PBP1A n=1 Tax=Streptococcus mitis TaxID=28037 RepID=UPI0021B5BA69